MLHASIGQCASWSLRRELLRSCGAATIQRVAAKYITSRSDNKSRPVHAPGEVVARPLNIWGNAAVRRRGRTYKRSRRACD